jgi:hypothetical protein
MLSVGNFSSASTTTIAAALRAHETPESGVTTSEGRASA